MNLVNQVEGIEVNPATFSKIAEHLEPNELESVKKWYEEMTAAGNTDLYFVTKRVFENGDSIPPMGMPFDHLAGIFVLETNHGTWNQNEWFPIRPQGGKEMRILWNGNVKSGRSPMIRFSVISIIGAWDTIVTCASDLVTSAWSMTENTCAAVDSSGRVGRRTTTRRSTTRRRSKSSRGCCAR